VVETDVVRVRSPVIVPVALGDPDTERVPVEGEDGVNVFECVCESVSLNVRNLVGVSEKFAAVSDAVKMDDIELVFVAERSRVCV
jgi:hypothetical protein